MLYSHKFIDVLRGASKEATITLIGTTAAKSTAFAELINAAEKFDFGEIPLESQPHPDGTAFVLPKLTNAEREAFIEGMIPLPAPLCWFEFTLNGHRSCILVQEGWRCSRYDWNDEIIFDDHTCTIQLATDNDHDDKVQLTGTSFMSLGATPQIKELYGTIPVMAIFLALMLCSRSTEITASPPPPTKLNAARARRARAPLAQHRVVRIVPEAYIRARRAEQNATDRLPPRLHWRRSHIRTLNRATEQERRVLIPRCLVGRAADAEVSHEYRIINPGA